MKRITVMISVILLTGCGMESPAQEERLKRMQKSPQYKDGKFANPIDVPLIAEGKTWEYIKKAYFRSRKDTKPAGEIPIQPFHRNAWVNKDKLIFTWLGHSSILITMDGKTILVDPVLEERASPFSWIGPKRFHPSPVTVKELPYIDVVLITHDHFDHLEEPTIKKLETKTGIFLMPLGIGKLLEQWDIPPNKIVELDWWEDHQAGSLKFTAAPTIHYARRGLFDGNKRLWCSFSVQGKANNIFISGDSGFFDGFKKIGEKLGPFHITFLKIGSYDDTWKQIHMLPEEAVQQHLDLRGGVIVPLHWATFDLALHPWYEPVERMITSAQEKGVRYITPIIGARININKLPAVNTWWRRIDKN
jgi:L-ascorbate metabolism protein UlaG (beta-lactamase superfamily)